MSNKAIWGFASLFAVATVSIPEQARADEYHVFLTASCQPSIGFFSIQTHGVYNPGDGVIESDENLLTSAKLEKNPYTCRLSDFITITVKGLCRSQIVPEEIPCGPGRGPGVEEIAVYGNDALIMLSDGPYRVSESTNWLSLFRGGAYERHSVELSVASQIFGLDVLQCRSPEGYPLRYLHNGTLAPLATECRSFQQMLPNR